MNWQSIKMFGPVDSSLLYVELFKSSPPVFLSCLKEVMEKMMMTMRMVIKRSVKEMMMTMMRGAKEVRGDGRKSGRKERKGLIRASGSP